jgi:hypothetical protein
MRRKIALASTACVAATALALGSAGSAQALACSRWQFRVGGGSTTYYYYGVDSLSGGMATATTGIGGTPCLLYTRSVSTVIQLPNGSRASHSSLLGTCSSGISIVAGSYNVFQIKSTHTLNLWNGQSWSYVD